MSPTENNHRSCTQIIENDGKLDDLPVQVQVLQFESRSLRAFDSSEKYLFAMKEDLAEWLNTLYSLDINVYNFMEKLETGVVLCRHSNNVMQKARILKNFGNISIQIPEKDVVYRASVKPATFQARDNVSNFISWCRKISIHECLLFETDDLVLRKNERSFVLCLLEVARKGVRFGMLAPLIIQLEQEIDREIEAEKNSLLNAEKNDDLSETDLFDNSNKFLEKMSDLSEMSNEDCYGYTTQIITNDLKTLHQRVADLLSYCTCPIQFPMIKIADGKYRIGDTKTLIFVRILRNHVMVRVGGGWDTLEHYLFKHDPCRYRSGQKLSNISKLAYKVTGEELKPEFLVTFDRTKRCLRSPNSVDSETSTPTYSSGSTSRRSSSSSSLGAFSILQASSTPNLMNPYPSSNHIKQYLNNNHSNNHNRNPSQSFHTHHHHHHNHNHLANHFNNNHFHEIQVSRSSQYSDDSSVSSKFSYGSCNSLKSDRNIENANDIQINDSFSENVDSNARKEMPTERKIPRLQRKQLKFNDEYLNEMKTRSNRNLNSNWFNDRKEKNDCFNKITCTQYNLNTNTTAATFNKQYCEMRKVSKIPLLINSRRKIENRYLSKSTKDLTSLSKEITRNLENSENSRRSVIALHRV